MIEQPRSSGRGASAQTATVTGGGVPSASVSGSDTSHSSDFKRGHEALFSRPEVWKLCGAIARRQSEIYQKEIQACDEPRTAFQRLKSFFVGRSSSQPELLQTIYVPGKDLSPVAAQMYPDLGADARNRATAAILTELYKTGLVEPITRAGGPSNAGQTTQVIGVRIKNHDLFIAARAHQAEHSGT